MSIFWAVLILSVQLMIPVSAAALDKKEFLPLPKNHTLFNSPELYELYSRYAADPNYHFNPQKPAIKELPSALKTMLNEGRTTILDKLFKTANNIIFQKASVLADSILYFSCSPDNPPAGQLAQMLDQAEVSLKIISRSVTELTTWLDWYPKDDWHDRFGKNGFYDHLQQLKQQLILTRCAYGYYHSLAYEFLPDPASLGRNRPESYYGNLKERLLDLKVLLQSDVSAETKYKLRLWQLRLIRRIYGRSAKLDEFCKQLTTLLKNISNKNIRFEFQVEILRCLADQKAMPRESIDPLISQINKLRQWTDIQQSKLSDIENKTLRLTLFESHLRQLKIKLSGGKNETIQQKYLSDLSYLQPLKDLSEHYPDLNNIIHHLIAARLASSLDSTWGPENKSALLPENTDIFYLFILGRYFQQQKPPQSERAAKIYEMVMGSLPFRDSRMPITLYELGQCYYLLSKKSEQHGDNETTVQQKISAIMNWYRLAREFPQWESSPNNSSADTQTAISLAASMAYSLYTNSAEKYAPLARQVLSILVGRIESPDTVPVGPFAHTEAAKHYRYYYALTLKAAAQYPEAAAMFGAVPRQDSRHTEARYYAVYCQFLEHKNNDSKTPAPDNIYRLWIQELSDIIKNNPTHSISTKATLLLNQINQKLNRIPAALQNIYQALKTTPDNADLAQAALSLLQDQRPALLQLHAQDKQDQLAQTLSQSLSIALLTYNTFSQDKSHSLFPVAFRVILEHLSLATVTDSEKLAAFGNIPKLAENIITTSGLAEKVTQSLWFVRCQAFLAWARKDYYTSRKLWYRIRQATTENQDSESQYLWWGARYFGLRCLLEQGQPDRVRHALKILLRSQPDQNNPWLTRLNLMAEKTITPG